MRMAPFPASSEHQSVDIPIYSSGRLQTDLWGEADDEPRHLLQVLFFRLVLGQSAGGLGDSLVQMVRLLAGGYDEERRGSSASTASSGIRWTRATTDTFRQLGEVMTLSG